MQCCRLPVLLDPTIANYWTGKALALLGLVHMLHIMHTAPSPTDACDSSSCDARISRHLVNMVRRWS
jgi:hypothetical protein